MADRYFFDKRDVKRFLLKYGIMFIVAIPIIIGINILFAKWFNADNMIFLDIVFLCVIFVLGELICHLWKQKRKKEGDRLNEK